MLYVYRIAVVSCLVTLWIANAFAESSSRPVHYVFFGFDRERISESWFLNSDGFEGAQLRYSWKELELSPDVYDFSAIASDLKTLSEADKQLFVQIQDVSFVPANVHVPDYLREDPRYNGGADMQFAFKGDDESTATPEGWVARRWDPNVRARFESLLAAIGREFDGKIAGINLSETAVGFGEDGSHHPEGFTAEGYRKAIIALVGALNSAFQQSTTLVYANFMPGDWSMSDGPENLKAVYAAAHELGVGVGGPDIKVNRRWQMRNSYPLIKESSGVVPTGVAVQWGNYQEVDPTTGKPVTVEGIYTFARDYLEVDYIFWGTQPPYFRDGVVPFVEELHKAK